MGADVPETAAAIDTSLLPVPWVVRERMQDTGDVATLVLEPAAGAESMNFLPGQFNMLYAFGVGEVPISVSGDPRESARLVHTIRDVGMVTRALCGLGPGDVVGVRGPYGRHWPIEAHEGRDIVLAAGGIGLAPLRPVLYHVLANRERYGRVAVLYGVRESRDVLYPGEFDHWRARGVQVEVTVDTADADWAGHVGVVTTLLRHARFEGSAASAFVCGPEIMMRFAAEELEKREVAADRIFVSMERNMKCAVGFCGHCQLGPDFVCLDGPVFTWSRMRVPMLIREL
jgi:NAD(P)H-flavin reductase